MRYFKFNLRKESLAIILILAVAAILRIYRLSFHDLWYDEIYSIVISGDFWKNWNPPLYFAILHYWIKLFGISEFSLRFPSVIFSVFGVYFTFLLGKLIFNFRVGIIAAILMTLSAFCLWYAQEARPYSLSMFLGTVSTYCLFKVLIQKKDKAWFLFILAAVFLLYSDITYFSFFLLFTQLLIILFIFRKKISFRIFYCLPVFLLFLPRLTHFLSKLHSVREGFWIPIPNLKSMVITIDNFNLGYNSYPAIYLLSITLSCIVLLRCLFLLKEKKEWIMGIVSMLFLIFLPILLIFIVSKTFITVYLDRGLITFSPYYYILLALGLEFFVSNKWFKTTIILALISCFLIGTYGYYNDWMVMPLEHHLGTYLKMPFKPAVRFMENNFRNGDIVTYTNLSSRPSFEFYQKKNKVGQYFLFYPGMIDYNYNVPFRSGKGNIDTNDINITARQRLWVISCDWPRDGNLDENSNAVKNELDKRYKRELSLSFDGLWIFRYVK